MMSAVGDQGRLGFTAVADDLGAARALYARTERILRDEAAAALESEPLT
jgi:hypothetical protein